MIKYITFIILTFIIFGCTCLEPDQDYIKNDFIKYYPDYRLVSIKNTENSPPVFYWEIKYELKNQTKSELNIETWQYWETKEKCKWKLRIIKQDTNYYIDTN